MRLPQVPVTVTSREMLSNFAGYNHNLKINDAEFYDMHNMTSSYYPVLSPRDRRAIGKTLTKPNGLIAKDALAYVDGDSLYYNDKKIDGIVLNTETEKTLLSMGSLILIFPDNISYNTTNAEIKYLEATQTSNEVKLTLCKSNGESYESISETAPESPNNGDLWIDTSGEKDILKQYSSSTGMWTQVATTFIKISGDGIGNSEDSDGNLQEPFKKYDGVKISGLTGDAEMYNGTQLIQGVGKGYIIIIGILNKQITVNSEVKIERKLPKMDYYVESENRIWGCRYGTSYDGRTVNEIYACALGDPSNWNQFRGISTDSYAVSLGSDGVFTGAITHGGCPLFFKENCIHKVYGNLPSNYQIITTNCRGVQQGSSKSLVIVNEILYYKSALDVCAYDGSLPVSISEALGQEYYRDAVAGEVNGKYYISMRDSFGEYSMFVFDTFKKLWHKEDNTQALDFARFRNKFFYIDAKDKTLKSPTGDSYSEKENPKLEDDVSWSVTSGIMGYELPDKKYNSKFNIRMNITAGAYVDMFIEYDSSGVWEHKAHFIGNNLRTFTVPVIPHRCDHMRLKISGKGIAKIFSITKVIEQGSDV